jgi:hypothetical protein
MEEHGIINILTNSDETNNLWRCLLENVFGLKARCYKARDFKILSKEMLEASLWIAEVWDTTLSDPVGFRTAYELAGKFRFLLIFNNKPEKNFPDEGPFWITYSYFGDLKKKIDRLINNPPLPREQYEELAGKYPQLISKPINYHHHH